MQILLNQPGLDDASMMRDYATLIDTSCDHAFVERTVPEEKDSFYADVLELF